MPVSLVKLSAVSRCRSSIWGLFTIRTLMLFGSPAELPPPAPAQAEALRATHKAPGAGVAARIFGRIKDSFVLQGVHRRGCVDCGIDGFGWSGPVIGISMCRAG